MVRESWDKDRVRSEGHSYHQKRGLATEDGDVTCLGA